MSPPKLVQVLAAALAVRAAKAKEFSDKLRALPPDVTLFELAQLGDRYGFDFEAVVTPRPEKPKKKAAKKRGGR